MKKTEEKISWSTSVIIFDYYYAGDKIVPSTESKSNSDAINYEFTYTYDINGYLDTRVKDYIYASSDDKTYFYTFDPIGNLTQFGSSSSPMGGYDANLNPWYGLFNTAYHKIAELKERTSPNNFTTYKTYDDSVYVLDDSNIVTESTQSIGSRGASVTRVYTYLTK